VPLLEVLDLSTSFDTDEGSLEAVRGVSFYVNRGEVLGVVGESGSGKSVTALSLLRLIDPPGRITRGRVLLEDARGGREDLLLADDTRIQMIRGNRMAMVFQDPMSALNPYMRVGEQLAEVLTIHKDLGRKDAFEKSTDMLARVGIADPAARALDYPHQLSGGMRQRVMIAMALLCEPMILIADEPTTALDVTIQAQILDLIRERKEAMGLGVILSTHDLGVIAEMADRVLVMYAGGVVEEGPVDAIFEDPRHPYTIGLARSVARLSTPRHRPLVPIPGNPPSIANRPLGCPFHPRCAFARDICKEQAPETRVIREPPEYEDLGSSGHAWESGRMSLDFGDLSPSRPSWTGSVRISDHDGPPISSSRYSRERLSRTSFEGPGPVGHVVRCHVPEVRLHPRVESEP